MDVRELKEWLREAEIREITARAERYAASILPHRRPEDINAEIQNIEMRYYELENEDEIERIERMSKRRLEEIRRKRTARRKGGK